ncbi:MAG: 5-(carboxyamino)imidazole ribonucleotide synthase [bacterium]
MNNKTIGIVGGGQLGRMLTDAAHKLGFKVIVLDPTPNSPAGQVADKQILGGFKDKQKILELADQVDFLTFELEGVDDLTLEEISKNGKPVNPDPKVLRIIRDKFKQKQFLKEHGIAVADFGLIESEEDCIKQGEVFGYPYLLKARFDAYDGRGNFVIKSKADISEAFKKLSAKSTLYAEKFVPFEKELAVVSARDLFNTIESFDVVETVHENNICHIVRSPADVGEETKTKAQNLAEKTLEALKGVGVFAVEMFSDKTGGLLVNEIAPRVHNSGHHTIEAYNASQFEQHIRAIAGMPLLKLKPTTKAAVMVNILGERDGNAEYKGGESVKDMGGVHVHLYGKMETRKERKMGHITAVADTQKEAENKALKAKKLISI